MSRIGEVPDSASYGKTELTFELEPIKIRFVQTGSRVFCVCIFDFLSVVQSLA